MAQRPVFTPKTSFPYYTTEMVEFHYAAGFATVQRQKNIAAIHAAYEKLHPGTPILEASSKAPTPLGLSLSPFYLMLGNHPVENVFQASKVFTKGGPFAQLLDMPAVKAKTTSITKTNGPLLYYEYDGEKLPVLPQGWFFTWLYLKALSDHPQLCQEVVQYKAFTDIAFNPNTGHACQAMALAQYCALSKKGLIEQALSSIDAFRQIVWRTEN
jgi:hypothetical protein